MSSRCSVLFFLAGYADKASSRVRGFWVAEQLEHFGMRCTLRWNHAKSDLLRFAFEIPKHDVIIFQKTYSRYHRWLMSIANWLGKQTYLDIDDAPSRTKSKVTLKNITAMMRLADGVFVGSQNLFDYVCQYQSSVYLIPSGIQLKNYQDAGSNCAKGTVCLGWVGNGVHYADDLIDTLSGPLRTLASRFSLRFKLVGACGEQKLYDTFGTIPNLGIEFIDEIDWSDPMAVSRATQDFDIGLYPLLPNDFNMYKCGFKALEYMANGIPVVASSVAVNAEIINNGTDGYLADSEDEWVTGLVQLIENVELRQKMGRAGRQKVEESFNTVKIAKRLKTIIEQDSNL